MLNCSVLEQDLPLVALAACILTFPGSLPFPSPQSPLHESTSSKPVSLYVYMYIQAHVHNPCKIAFICETRNSTLKTISNKNASAIQPG
ncbi:hypothetical protein I7I48_02856 [Histoplasma ohiense]|nr:hypothetical protein I7I48_02856 [Histoplasma ohiense (nom. inval.)]